MIPSTVTLFSARGGMGKSTLAAGIARAAARQGTHTVLIDFDMSGRSLDTVLGCEDRVVYDLGDLLAGRRDVRGVLLPVDMGLGFVPGAFHVDVYPDPVRLISLLEEVRREAQAELMILDTASVTDPVARMLVSLSETLLVVSSTEDVPLFSTASFAARLAVWGREDARLVLNRVPVGPKACDFRRMIDTAALPLCGLVPAEDPEVCTAYLTGARTDTVLFNAFSNIAARLSGGHRPLGVDVFENRRMALSV